MSDITAHIPLNPNLNCLIQNFLYFIRCQGIVASQMQIEKKSASNLSTVTSSMHSYLTYRKNVNNRLSQINTNISNTIIEGCRGIDSICYKVRQCLDESQNIGRSRSLCNELSWSNDETGDIRRKSDESTEVSLIESVHEVPTLVTHVEENITPAAIPEIDKKATKPQNSRERKVAKKLSLAKIKRKIQKRNQILEEFRETVMDQIEHNDFEAMEKIVEHINEDIENFDKNITKTEEAPIGEKVISNTQIEVLSTQPMDAQESMLALKTKEEQFENFEVVVSETTAPFLIPEVYPKPSILDLHKKLIAQLEANDSYLCFQRIMDMHTKKHKSSKMRQTIVHSPISAVPSVCRTISQGTVTDCSSTVSCQRRGGRRKKPHKKIRSDSQSTITSIRKKDAKGSEMRLANVRSDLYAKYSDSLWFSERYLGKVKASQSSVKSKRSTKERHKRKMEPTAVQNEKKPRINKYALRPTTKSSSISGGFQSNASLCLSRCTTSGYSCNLRINNDLPITPSTKCHLRWIRARNEQAPSRKIEFLDILDDLTPKDLLPLQSEYPRRDRQGGVKFFSEFQPKSSITCDDAKSIKNTYLYRLLHEGETQQTTWHHLLKPSIECCNVNCSACDRTTSKGDEKQQVIDDNTPLQDKSAAQKLLPYMQDPTINLHFQSLTVMPVRVFYDYNNYKLNGGRLNNDKNDARTKPPDQKSHPAPMKEATGPSRAKWGPPNQGSSKSLRVVNAILVKPQQQKSKMITNNAALQEGNHILNRRNSKSFSPKDNKQLEKFIRVQSDIEKMSKEIREKTPRGFERKLWANKYGKSVGHQLVSFVKNQPQESKPPLPKYALPKGPRVIKNTTRHKQMLAHLKGLKDKNDEIQTNIQKAINVIETKMIDILSAPGDSSSVEAFDLMEKEITNVLSLMKFSSKNNSRNSTPKTAEKLVPKKTDYLEEDFNSISDQLFQKLEKILDSDKSRPTTSASEYDKKDEEVYKNKQKSVVSRKYPTDDKYLSSSLTSTSLEDTNFHRKCNEKNSFNLNKKSRYGRCPISRKLHQNEQAQKENLTVEKIEREYATGENCSTEEPKPNNLNKQEIDTKEEADNSRGDCIKQSFEDILTGVLLEETMSSPMGDTTDIQDGKMSERQSKEGADIKINEDIFDYKSTEVNLVAPQTNKNKLQVEESESPAKSESEENDPGLSDQVNKIIKRVEDIYNHLDDIHISNNDQIPVFSEPPDVSDVHSQQFLTPFMQAIKEKRSRPLSPTVDRQGLQRSPSYYNVLTFLDTLQAIQQEKPIEVHTARLCHYTRSYIVPDIFHQAHVEYTVKTEKAGCLRKHSDEGKSKHKKVSFLVLKENKSCQASICPYHKFKVLKVSSQQFPSTEYSESPTNDCCSTNKSQLEVEEKDVIVLCDKRQNTNIQKDNNSEVTIPEVTKTVDLEIDQSTQVYCQTETQDPHSNGNLDQDDFQQVSESSASSVSDKPPQIQVFYDQSDADIPKQVLNNNNKGLDGFYSHQTILKVKNFAFPEFKPRPKIVVFREVSEVSGLLQPLKDLEKFSRTSLTKGSGQQLMKIDSESGDENVVLLKSFYAFVYIIMFTALNLDYRCA